MSAVPTNQIDYAYIHGVILSVAWFGLPNIAIWSLFFRSNKYAVYVHIASMGFSALLMMPGVMIMLVILGAKAISAVWYHNLIGFILLCLLPLILISGSVCKFKQDKPDAQPQKVVFGNKAHAIFGWIYIIVQHVPLLTNWFGNGKDVTLFVIIIVFDVLSYGAYFILKLKRAKVQSVSVTNVVTSNQLRIIKSAKDLQVYANNFFIFANYVYNISTVMGNHPGGWKIIQAVRSRQVDRFMYGVDPIEIYDVQKISHTLNSIKLAEKPIAVLKIPATYNLAEINEVNVRNYYCHDPKCTIYSLFFELPAGVKYQGYRYLSQIGQYYSLTINEKHTRLYTAVNFLQQKNLNFMSRVFKKQAIIHKNRNFPLQNETMKNSKQPLTIAIEPTISDNLLIGKQCLPLLIKKYDNGVFTKEFLQNQAIFQTIKISLPRGLGLQLDTVKSQNILILAAGTGIYPFSDLIDLIFKSHLIETQKNLTSEILQANPILNSNPFKKIQFKFYVSVSSTEEFHPVTLFQLNALSQTVKLKCFIKAPEQQQNAFFEKYPNCVNIQERFESIVSKQFANNQETMAYVCGPVRFTRALLCKFNQEGIPPSSYKIV